MPDPTRPIPGRRPKSGALIVILAAMMLVNLTTFGVLVSRGWFDAADLAAEEVPELPLAQIHTDEDYNLNCDRPERVRENTAVLEELVTPVTWPTEGPTADGPAEMPTPLDPPGAPSSVEPPARPQVASSTPDPSPTAEQELEPEPTSPPLQFFGLPIFE